MRDSLDIGATPAEEECQQVGMPNYDRTKAIAECRAFIHQLCRQFGPEPEGAQLRIKANPHDYGTYHEVACYYDDENEAANNYAFQCEGEAWGNWDNEARVELGLAVSPQSLGG